MLRAATAVLIVLWLLGLTTGFTMSSFIHVLPALAIIIELIRIDDAEEETLAASSQIEE
ncbi:MAG: lmo0937 family membrane protein [Syntrophales bacterium]|jgi:cation transporter-like permease